MVPMLVYLKLRAALEHSKKISADVRRDSVGAAVSEINIEQPDLLASARPVDLRSKKRQQLCRVFAIHDDGFKQKWKGYIAPGFADCVDGLLGSHDLLMRHMKDYRVAPFIERRRVRGIEYFVDKGSICQDEAP